MPRRMVLFFFFQAEDGIRDVAVTGVQTCALPIWKPGDPPNTRLREHYIVDQPGMHAIMQEMRALAEYYAQRVLIGELYLPVERLMPYYGEQLDEIHLPFNFQFVNLPTWEARTIRQAVEGYEAALPQEA